MELEKYCLAHLFTYQQFVDPPGSSDYVYGLAYIGSPNTIAGVCAGLYCYASVSERNNIPTPIKALFPGQPS